MDILEKIKPSRKEEQKLLETVRIFLNKLKIKDAKSFLGGSGAKDTWLKNSKEIDIFVKFNFSKYKNKSNQISKILEKELKKRFSKISKLHGSRDYFQIQFKGYTFEIIPILDIPKIALAKNITDASPFHVRYIKKYSKLKDEMRKSKAFCKAQNCYGAESYIQGFSGYVMELLTICYKSFNNLVKNAARWDSKVIIDIENKLKNPLKQLNKSKLQSPLILIDPTEPNRNAAAGLSKEKFEKFKKACKEYLKKPSIKFFEKKEEKIPKESFVLEIIPLTGKKDIVGGKLLRTLNFISRHLRLNGFEIKKFGWLWKEKKAYFWFIFKTEKLSKEFIHNGPPISNKKALENFKKKYKDKVKIRNKRSYVILKRKFTTVKDFLKDFVKHKEIKKRIKKIKS